ncbi:MAG: ATP-dependent DNA helicase [Synergistaceae bacterium]|nr:ATP-dependent DNA helicase [Synergistaceae bacterium]
MNWTTKNSLREFFTPDGVLARRLDGYEYRPQQLEFALAVQDFLLAPSGTVMAAEAPPGVGKTFAVLIPAILRALAEGRHILFLTASIALQEQLIGKDLPALVSVLGRGFSYGLLKGRNNYACLRKSMLLRGGLWLPSSDATPGPDIDRWVEETDSGDLAELALTPSHPAWQQMSAAARTCLGSSCPFRERCFVTRALRHAQDWQVVVANYHLFFSHLLGGRGSFPVQYDWLICDEAHRIPDAARNASTIEFGVEDGMSLLRSRTFSAFESLFAAQGVGVSLFQERAELCRNALGAVFSLAEIRCRPGEGISERSEELFHKGEELASELDGLLTLLRGIEDRFMAGAFENSSELGEVASVVKWADEVREFRSAMLWCLKVEHFPAWGYWRGANAMMSSPVVCSDIIRDALLAEAPEKSVMLSATLSLAGDFAFWTRETGIQPDKTLVVESPFDFEKQMEILVVDIGMSVASEGYDDRICRVMERLCDKNGGRSLILLSSMRLLRTFAARMRGRERDYEVLVQGDLPQRDLLRRFREDETSVLVGSVSFREGVDVPGDGLTQVIIDRIPFPHPFDPLVQARNVLEGRKAFMKVTLPNAKMFLRQAVGRLIRSSADHGRVVLLDGRALDRREWKILENLPSCQYRRLHVRE